MALRVVLLLVIALTNAHAVILYRTGDPNENTTPPTGADANSGWQYEGIWGGFLGTPFAPHFFISAAHIGDAGGSLFSYGGVTYHVIGQFNDSQSDLVIWEVREPFPSFAPLYSRTDEVRQRIIEIGRGTQRGSAIVLDNALKGWNWGAGDGVIRWGENVVSSIVSAGQDFDLLRAEFNADGLPNECHLSVGDSGGAAFINDAGTWKLAGINYAVDGPYYMDSLGNGAFNAALFDTTGFYEKDGNNYVPSSGASGLYPTRISTKLPWIAGTIARAVVGLEANFVTLTYTELAVPQTDLSYVVEQSSDLVSWQTADASSETISTNGSTQVVQSNVAINAQARMFVRLRVLRP